MKYFRKGFFCPHPASRARGLMSGLVLAASCTIGGTPAHGEAVVGSNPDDLIDSLLDLAEEAMRTGHLIYPAKGSAMSLYHETLTYQSDNPDALRGLEVIVEHYLEQAQQALDDGQLLKAQSMLSKARMVDPSSQALDPMARQIQLLENADRKKVTLDWRQVSRRSSSLAPQLEQMGGLARQPGCRVTISASDDSQGRWIYQQMSRAPGEMRIRARIRIASPSSVEVLCYEGD